MFKKFGEFDSWEELNKAAAAQLAEGDTQAVLAIAEENGIDKEDAQDYIEGIAGELCSPLMAALGKLKAEAEELELFGEFELYQMLIQQECQEDPEFTLAVRKKGKTLTGCLGKLLKTASKNRKKIPDTIAKAAGIPENIYTGALTKREALDIIRNYYKEA